MLTTDMLEVLRCPDCRTAPFRAPIERQAENRILDGQLVCEACGMGYPIRDGVPDLIPHHKLTTATWEVWQGHLAGFRARRREARRPPNRWQQQAWSQTHCAFNEFAQFPEGNLLDVGCGPGGMRHRVDPERVSYYGVDPLPTGEVDEFRYARAVAEHLPFGQGTFSTLVVSSALDHFCNLDAFFAEAVRVLRPDGKLLIQQHVHEARGIAGRAKMLIHRAKDGLDNWRTKRERAQAPKHISEFDESLLRLRLGEYFEIESVRRFNARWYSSRRLFLALRPLQASPAAASIGVRS
jgi:uncharacterized protein YbaR (Trm112 family)